MPTLVWCRDGSFSPGDISRDLTMLLTPPSGISLAKSLHESRGVRPEDAARSVPKDISAVVCRSTMERVGRREAGQAVQLPQATGSGADQVASLSSFHLSLAGADHLKKNRGVYPSLAQRVQSDGYAHTGVV